mgnify:CR=1 FL=1
MKKLIIVNGMDDDPSILINAETYEVIHTYDTYDGDNPNTNLLEKLGHGIIEEWEFDDLVDEEEYEPSDMTNKMPNLDLVIERLKEKHEK